MSLISIKELAEKEFPSFLESLHEKHPDLVLKYQVNDEMKNEFIEAVVRQVWNNEKYDMGVILEFMVERYRNLSKQR